MEKSAATAIVVTVSLVVQNRRQGCQDRASFVGWIKKRVAPTKRDKKIREAVYVRTHGECLCRIFPRKLSILPMYDPETHCISTFFRLKVLSTRWIQLKLCSLDRSSLKREARKVFRKIRPPPILHEPFKELERLLVF